MSPRSLLPGSWLPLTAALPLLASAPLAAVAEVVLDDEAACGAHVIEDDLWAEERVTVLNGTCLEVRDGGRVGELVVQGAVLRFMGGTIEGSLTILSRSEASISGGEVRGKTFLSDKGRATISGGTLDEGLSLWGEAVAEMSGGFISKAVHTHADSRFIMNGGTIAAAPLGRSQIIQARDRSALELRGGEVLYSPNAILLDSSSAILSGLRAPGMRFETEPQTSVEMSAGSLKQLTVRCRNAHVSGGAIDFVFLGVRAAPSRVEITGGVVGQLYATHETTTELRGGLFLGSWTIRGSVTVYGDSFADAEGPLPLQPELSVDESGRYSGRLEAGGPFDVEIVIDGGELSFATRRARVRTLEGSTTRTVAGPFPKSSYDLHDQSRLVIRGGDVSVISANDSSQVIARGDSRIQAVLAGGPALEAGSAPVFDIADSQLDALLMRDAPGTLLLSDSEVSGPLELGGQSTALIQASEVGILNLDDDASATLQASEVAFSTLTGGASMQANGGLVHAIDIGAASSAALFETLSVDTALVNSGAALTIQDANRVGHVSVRERADVILDADEIEHIDMYGAGASVRILGGRLDSALVRGWDPDDPPAELWIEGGSYAAPEVNAGICLRRQSELHIRGGDISGHISLHLTSKLYLYGTDFRLNGTLIEPQPLPVKLDQGTHIVQGTLASGDWISIVVSAPDSLPPWFQAAGAPELRVVTTPP